MILKFVALVGLMAGLGACGGAAGAGGKSTLPEGKRSGAKSTSGADISKEAANLHTGTYALHYWKGEPFAFTLSQTLTDLPDGKYTLSAWIQGGGGEDIQPADLGLVGKGIQHQGDAGQGQAAFGQGSYSRRPKKKRVRAPAIMPMRNTPG